MAECDCGIHCVCGENVRQPGKLVAPTNDASLTLSADGAIRISIRNRGDNDPLETHEILVAALGARIEHDPQFVADCVQWWVDMTSAAYCHYENE